MKPEDLEILKSLEGWRSCLDDTIKAEALLDSRLTVAAQIDHVCLHYANFDVQRVLKHDMAREMALHLEDRLEISTRPLDYCDEFSASLYVFTEDQFEFLVKWLRKEGKCRKAGSCSRSR